MIKTTIVRLKDKLPHETWNTAPDSQKEEWLRLAGIHKSYWQHFCEKKWEELLTDNKRDILAEMQHTAKQRKPRKTKQPPTTFTPGPWRSHEKGYVHSATGECICSFHEMRNRLTNYKRDGIGEANANARLIAAAPEMLDALKQADYRLTYISSQQQREPKEFEVTRSIITVVRAAIATAEGR